MKRDGYIAITSAIIISIVLMAVVLATGATGFRSRANTLAASYKAESRYLAEACVDYALLELAENTAYAGNETVAVGEKTCAILPIESLAENPPKKQIRTNATVMNAKTSLKVKVISSDLSLFSWEEEMN